MRRMAGLAACTRSPTLVGMSTSKSSRAAPRSPEPPLDDAELHLLTAEQADAQLRVSRRTLGRLIASGRLRVSRTDPGPHGHLRVSVAELRRFVAAATALVEERGR